MNRQNADSLTGGIFLIGLGLLFWFNWLWPGILALIGVVSFFNQWAKGNLTGGLTTLIIFGGLALFFSVNLAWGTILPLALIGLGLIGLVSALRRS